MRILLEEEQQSLLNSKGKDFKISNGLIDAEIGANFEDHLSSFDAANQVTLSWHCINAFVQPPKASIFSRWRKGQNAEHRHILKNVSGEVKPGQLLAIMGASGAGKTTLINVLTNRNLRKLDVSGTVRVNGRPVGSAITRLSAYVQQDDLFIGTLTVQEHLIFQALLRMDKTLSYQERMKRVQEVTKELGLVKCSNTVIGDPGRIKGISGGERKRLAFAAEVLTNPALMFCDEPTSGLDSFKAQNVISVLRDMAEGGRTIVCTIHQPSSELYAMFHYLLLMAEGRVAYMGDAANAVNFFEKMNLQCPNNFNPADFFIYNLAVVPGREEESKQKLNHICDEFAKEYGSEDNTTDFYNSLTNPENDRWANTSRYKASWFAQMRAVMWRSFLNVKREPQLTTVRIAQTLIVAVVLGLIYWQQELDQSGIMNINGAVFLLLTNMSFQCMFAVVNVFCLELPVFLREHWNGMYRVDVYFICKTFAEVPIFLFLPLIFTTIFYWMIGLNKDGVAFVTSVAIVTLVANTASSFGYLMSCLFNSITMALSFGPPLLIPLMLFGGFFLNNNSVPVYFIWIKYLSWFYYGNEALAINQWRNVKNIRCAMNTTVCIPNGKIVLKTLNFEEDNFVQDICLVFALLVFFRIVAFLALFWKASRKT